jgi:hypothetical protein
MMNITVRKRSAIAALLIMIAMLFTLVPTSLANQQYRKRPSKTKNIAVGTAIGAVGGALIGGKTGALIGAGGGAGAGYLVYRHKKKKHNKQYRYTRYNNRRY